MVFKVCGVGFSTYLPVVARAQFSCCVAANGPSLAKQVIAGRFRVCALPPTSMRTHECTQGLPYK